MKKILLMAIGFLPIIVYGQLTLITDDFESYTAGEPLAANSPIWTTWTSGSSSEDADVSNAQASSGSNSVHISSLITATDLILPLASDYSSGIYEMTMKVYVVSGFGGYWNYQASSTPAVAWMMDIYFEPGGAGKIDGGGLAAATFAYTPDVWTSFKIQVNLTSDQAEVWIDGNSIHTWQWSLTSSGTGNVHTWGGMDIYALGPPTVTYNTDFYVDDVTFSQVFGTGIAEESILSGIQISPNPSNGEFGIVMNAIPAGQYKMQIADMRGMLISSEAIEVNGSTKKNFNVDLPAGVYFLKISNDGYETTRKLVIN